MVPLLLLLLLPLLFGGSLQQRQREYYLQLQQQVAVEEGLCVHVSCSFSYSWSSWYSPGKVYTSWYQYGEQPRNSEPVATNKPRKQVKKETQNRFFLAGPSNNNCSLSIRDARKTDTGIYVFHVEDGYNGEHTYQDYTLTLKITDLTQRPDIYILKPLVSGQPTQLTCSLPGSCEGGSPLNFSWEGDALDSLNPQTLRSSVLSFTPRPQDHGTKVTCQVKKQRLCATMQTIHLNVSYAPRNLTIEVSIRNVTALKILQTSSLPILKGEALRLLCVADSNPPAVLSWFRGSPAQNATPISSTAILDLPAVGTGEEGQFTCQAWHPLGSQNISLRLSMVGQSVSMSGIVPAALGGAGAMALLSLCLCLIFCIVKARRKQAAGRPKVTNNEDPVMGTVTWDSQQKPGPDGPPDHVSNTGDASPLREEPDVQYANVSFHGRKPREPQKKEATSICVYSEIKTGN